ncbi:MAG: hypothetical protein EKK52_13605 [Burkholderiales bacterium]|uniref:hypothetical protein n=1 Tax=Roseateles sp. TaxID=1971397 RepID=UPI000F953BE6|nr:MAG: hypothetical protein EKK52_13605 [Burkholderiales bacterium]
MVGSVTLQPPAARRGGGWRPAVARLVRMDVDAEHEKLGCPQALLDVARIWASASEYDALEVSVPAAPVGVVDFYLANGFHIVSSSHDAGSRRLNVVLSLKLAESRPHSDAWYSKHHGAWFASMTRH